MDKTVHEHQEYIKSCIIGYDNSLSSPKAKLSSILDSIDSNPDISNSTIHNQFNLVLRTIGFYLLRKKQQSKAQWLQDSAKEILHMLYVYKCLKQTIIKVDNSLLAWYTSSEYDNSNNLLDGNEESFIFINNDILYYVDKMSKDLEVSVLFSSPNPGKPGYNILHKSDSDTLRMLCNNKSCPRWKNAINKAYDDGSKYCSCSIADTQKCGYIHKCGILEPIDALDMTSAIIYCMHNRTYNANENKRDSSEYEHIPRPERLDDVVVYYGFTPEKHRTLNSELSPIPGSHASPREHSRRGGNRRGYYRKDGTYVRPTTFKATTVNKGHTKTSYILKESKKKG